MRDAEIKIVHHIQCEACFLDDARGHNIAIVSQRLAAHESEKILQAMRSHPGERPMFSASRTNRINANAVFRRTGQTDCSANVTPTMVPETNRRDTPGPQIVCDNPM
jgi:hypothetical protein